MHSFVTSKNAQWRRLIWPTLYNRRAKLVSTLSANKPCDIRTFELNRTFKVIPGHPCWCRQKSRTMCGRNVQLIPTLFLKRTKISQREKRQIRRFQRPHSRLTTPQQETPSNVYNIYIRSTRN